jgi:hypothetical protein
MTKFIPTHFLNVLLGICMLFGGSMHALAGERVALVIGNANYNPQALDVLRGPGNDAADVAAELQRLGFKLVPPPTGKTSNIDLSGRQLRDQVAQLGRMAQGAELAVLYYSGHATSSAGESYLLPVDLLGTTAADLQQNSLSLSALLAQLDTGAKSTIVVLDACRSTPRAKSAGTGKGLANAPQSDDFLIAFATAAGDFAEDLGTNRRNSPYTQAFLAELKRDPTQEVEDLFKVVRREVKLKTGAEQLPEMQAALTETVRFREEVLAPSQLELAASNDDQPNFFRDSRGRPWTKKDNGSDIAWNKAVEHCKSLGRDWSLPSQSDFLEIFIKEASVTIAQKDGKPPLVAYTYLPLKIETNAFWAAGKPNSWIDLGDKSGELGLKLDVSRHGHAQRALCVKLGAVRWVAVDAKLSITNVEVEMTRGDTDFVFTFSLLLPNVHWTGEQITRTYNYAGLWAQEWNGKAWSSTILDIRKQGSWPPKAKFTESFQVPMTLFHNKDLSKMNMRLCIGTETSCLPTQNLVPTKEAYDLVMETRN